jgi:general secretion pathway protein D
MKPARIAHRPPAAALLLLSILIAGCAGGRALQRADLEVQRGNLDTAIAYYQQILQEDPGNTQAKIALAHAKLQASQQHEKNGLELAEAGQLEEAVMELQLAVRLDSGNEIALRELGRVQGLLAEQRRAEREQLTPTEQAVRDARTAASVLPQLDPQVTGPISLDFPNSPVQDIYRTLAQLAGLNVLFETTLQDVSTSFRIQSDDFHEALRVLTSSHGHFTKVLSPTTFMVVPDDVTKRREFADQVMRTFYLSNADVGIVEAQIRGILQTQQISSNADLNSITVRDTPEALRIVERLITSADKAVGEILLEVEVLEVSRETVSNYGLALEPFQGRVQIPPTVDEGGNVLGLSLNTFEHLTSADIFVSIPTLFYQFLRTTNDFRLVAQPKLRATEGETTILLIGEEVPVVDTTFNPQSTIGGNVVPISSTTYRPTGISLEVLPRVHFNGEITLDIQIQVSAVTGTATVASVGDLPVFTTREVGGRIRLRDGETNVIAGLLQDNDIRSRRGIIGLDRVPGLSHTSDTRDQTDIVISITPHLLRGAQITAEDLDAVYVGTATGIGGGIAGAFGGPRPLGPGAVAPGAAPGAAVQQQAPEQPAVLALLPAEHVIQVDQEFAIDVAVQGVTELFSAGFELRYDASVIDYVDFFEGGFIDRDGAEATVQVTRGGAGSVRVGMTRMGAQQGVSGSGSLVTLVFRGVGEGTTSLQISAASLRRQAGGPIPTQMLPATVQVRPRNE